LSWPEELILIELVDTRIQIEPLIRAASRPAAGAVVAFVGVTREFTGTKQTVELRYESYRELALARLAQLETSARERWSLVECIVVHRLGHVPVGEASVAVVVSSAHRQVAFEAAGWLIDTLKRDVPIWKQEHFADGSREWIHPGTSSKAGLTAD
jgi:molybdopterin synthase catalytic subunit